MKHRKLHSFTAYAFGLLLSLAMTSAFVSCSDDDSDEDGGASPLGITSLNPEKARVGEIVTINGTGFSTTPSQNSVMFKSDGAPDVPAMVQEATATVLKVVVPANAGTGNVTVTVSGRSATSPKPFTLDASLGAPVVTSLNPTNAFVNAEITITGSGFGTSRDVVDVLFGTVEATEVVSVTATTITVKVPTSLKPGEVAVKVVRDGVASTTTLRFTVNATPTSVKTAYWSDGDNIFRGAINDEGGVDIKILYTDDRSRVKGVAIDQDGGYIYWGRVGGVSRALLDGTGPIEDVYSDDMVLSNVYDIAIDHAGDNIYFTSYDANFAYSYIHKGNLDGSAAYTTLLQQDFMPLANNIKLAVADDMLYWTSAQMLHVARASLKGEFTPEILFTAEDDNLQGPSGVAVHKESGKIFITDNAQVGSQFESRILQGNLNGTGALTTLVPSGNNVRNPYDAEIDHENGYFFWLNSSTDGGPNSDIMRVKLDGTNVEKLFEGFTNGNSFDIEVR